MGGGEPLPPPPSLAGSAIAERSSVFNITYYGAKGDGRTVNTLAFRQAIDACAKSGGGTVDVPAGEFVSGTIVLRSHVNLHLEAGANWFGAPPHLPDMTMFV